MSACSCNWLSWPRRPLIEVSKKKSSSKENSESLFTILKYRWSTDHVSSFQTVEFNWSKIATPSNRHPILFIYYERGKFLWKVMRFMHFLNFFCIVNVNCANKEKKKLATIEFSMATQRKYFTINGSMHL